jgi:hypothetical protein
MVAIGGLKMVDWQRLIANIGNQDQDFFKQFLSHGTVFCE